MKLFLTNQPTDKLNENEVTFNLKKTSTFKTTWRKALHGSSLEGKKRKTPKKYCDTTHMMLHEGSSFKLKQYSIRNSEKINLR